MRCSGISMRLPRQGDIINGFRVLKHFDSTYHSEQYEATRLYDRAKCVIKIQTVSSANEENEIEFLNDFECPNIIKPYAMFTYNGLQCIVFPRAELSDTLNFLCSLPSNEILSEKLVRRIMISCLTGLKYMHDRGVAHRDIKPENIVIMRENPDEEDIKIIDLGFAAKADHRGCFNDDIGTEIYKAPETSTGEYTTSCDIFSLGVTMFTLIEKLFPFNPNSNTPLYDQKIIGPNFNTKRWARYDPSLKTLIESMLDPNPYTRISIEDALESDFLKESDNISAFNIGAIPVAISV